MKVRRSIRRQGARTQEEGCSRGEENHALCAARLRNGSGVEVRAAVGLCCAASPQGKESKRRKGDLRRFVSATNGTSGTSSSTKTAGPRSPTSTPAGISPPARRPSAGFPRTVCPPFRSYLRLRHRTKPIPTPTPRAARTAPNPGVVVRSDCPGARSEGTCTMSVSRPAWTVISQTIWSPP